MLAIKIFYVICFSLTAILALDYCKLCKRESHTLCKYKEGPSFRCLDYKKPEFTTSVKKYIVDIHNDIRNHVASGQETRGALGRQPSASNMNILTWDNELAEIAQRWADQCIGLNENIQHDDCRKTERFEVGQNILTAVTPSLDIPEIAILILNWYKQVENVLPSDVENFSGIQRGKFLIGQYTQLIWAETRYFGCGMSTFKNENSSLENYRYLHRLVCNYGPRGNLIGSSVYERGIPCSKCPLGNCDSIRTSLCEGVKELHVSEKHGGTVYAEKFSQYNVYLPTYLFNTVSLGYILKHNLTEFIYNVLQKTNSRNQEIKCFIKNVTEIFEPEELLSLPPHTEENEIKEKKYNFSKIRHRDYFKPIESPLASENRKKMADLLNHNEHISQFDRNVYELQEGIIVVDDCKHHAHLSQYDEDVSATEKVSDNADIVLPNNIVYKKLKGTWFHGNCRCNYVYRSTKEGSRTIFLREFIKLILLFVTIFVIK